MTDRRIVSTRFPYVPVRVTVRAQVVDVEAFLDTGFDGSLLMPAGVFSDLGLPDLRTNWTLADGTETSAPAYIGNIALGPLGLYRVLVAVLGNHPLLGRAVTDGFTVVLEHGRRLIVEP